MEKKRVCIIVIDSVGIGAMPDAADFGDLGANTLKNIFKHRGLKLPNLYAMGLGNIEGSGLPKAEKPTAAFGRMAQMTKAKDTTSGHWELCGLIMDKPFKTYPNGFPLDLLDKWSTKGWLGNKPASGTEIIKELGNEHVDTGKPIVYTSADSVFQVAAHEEIIRLPDLYRLCERAREMLPDVGRIIARPFVGDKGNFIRTKNRKDYAVAPISDTILDGLVAKGKTVLGIGKIEDIFSKRGITHVNHTTNNLDGINATIEALRNFCDSDVDLDSNFNVPNNPGIDDIDLIFTNLVDFDMLYGHRNDPEGYGAALEYFDSRVPEILSALKPGDLLFITADHGCDPTIGHTDHTREYVPVLAYGMEAKDLGTRDTFADLGATVYQYLCGEPWPVGKAFCNE